MTGEEMLESNRGTPDGSLEGEKKLVSGLVEKGMHDPLHETEVESSDESIIVIEEDNKYVQFGRHNSGLPIAKEERSHPPLLSDSESEDEFEENPEVTKSTYLDFSDTNTELMKLLLDDGELEDPDD